MNSEELEQSLRTEFEEQLKNVFAEMRQELAQLQEKVEAEFEKHKSQLSEVFQDFSARIESEKELDASFSDSVVEHLRLARDEGARITATAIAEAEEMQRAQAAEESAAAATQQQEEAAAQPPSVDIGEMRDAIKDISSQTSQSSILKSLVQHAEKFTTRGAFFILKNEHFVGWRVFGSSQEAADEQTVREIFFPVSSETILGESVRSLSAVESSYGTYSDDSVYLGKLGFGQPEKMFAIPLVARGRGVAVLYADSGEQNEQVNVEALETLVRVAGLTVEVIASNPAGSSPARDSSAQPQPTNYSKSGDSSVPTQEKETNATQTENRYQPEVEEPTETSATESYQPEEAHNFADSQATDFSAFHEAENAEKMPGEATSYQSPSNDFSFQSSQQFEPESLTADDFEVEVIQDEDEAETQEFHFASQGNEESQTDYGQTETPVENYPWTSTYTENLSSSSSNATDDDDLIESSYQPTYEPATTEEDFSAPTTTAAANDEYPSFENTEYESEQPTLSSPQMQFEETPAFDISQYEEEQQPPSNNAASPDEDFSFSNNNSYDSFRAENDNSSDFAASPAAAVAPAPTAAEETTSQQPAAVATPPIKSRFSDRNVDLPIEVSEDERRLHNDARRFARLLVSEIKLYNEQKVKEGREAHDLYERLREAIDRSREMYDKRVQPPVAAKFDYFHYELVNTLAEGEPTKLGGSYQGAAV